MLAVHETADAYAETIIEKSRNASGTSHPFPLSAGALYNLSQDSLILHRSVAALCTAGWAAATPHLLRAQLEILGNSAVIWNDEEPEYMAFKYQFSFLVTAYRKNTSDAGTRQNARAQLEEGIERLPEELQARARDFAFKDKLQGYWYRPEISGPTDAIEKYGRPEIKDTYRSLSSSVHGGFLGMRLFRDDPDRISAARRADPEAVARALSISSVVTMDQYHFRAHADGIDDSREFEFLRRLVVDFGRKAEASRIRRHEVSGRSQPPNDSDTSETDSAQQEE